MRNSRCAKRRFVSWRRWLKKIVKREKESLPCFCHVSNELDPGSRWFVEAVVVLLGVLSDLEHQTWQRWKSSVTPFPQRLEKRGKRFDPIPRWIFFFYRKPTETPPSRATLFLWNTFAPRYSILAVLRNKRSRGRICCFQWYNNRTHRIPDIFILWLTPHGKIHTHHIC